MAGKPIPIGNQLHRLGHVTLWYSPESDEEAEAYEQARDEIKSALIACQEGIDAAQAMRFLEEQGIIIRFKEMGFEHFNELLFHCQDFLDVRTYPQTNPKYPKTCYLFIRATAVDLDSRHVLALVQNQRKPEPKKKNMVPPPTLSNLVYASPEVLLQNVPKYAYYETLAESEGQGNDSMSATSTSGRNGLTNERAVGTGSVGVGNGNERAGATGCGGVGDRNDRVRVTESVAVGDRHERAGATGCGGGGDRHERAGATGCGGGSDRNERAPGHGSRGVGDGNARAGGNGNGSGGVGDRNERAGGNGNGSEGIHGRNGRDEFPDERARGNRFGEPVDRNALPENRGAGAVNVTRVAQARGRAEIPPLFPRLQTQPTPPPQPHSIETRYLHDDSGAPTPPRTALEAWNRSTGVTVGGAQTSCSNFGSDIGNQVQIRTRDLIGGGDATVKNSSSKSTVGLEPVKASQRPSRSLYVPPAKALKSLPVTTYAKGLGAAEPLVIPPKSKIESEEYLTPLSNYEADENLRIPRNPEFGIAGRSRRDSYSSESSSRKQQTSEVPDRVCRDRAQQLVIRAPELPLPPSRGQETFNFAPPPRPLRRAPEPTNWVPAAWPPLSQTQETVDSDPGARARHTFYQAQEPPRVVPPARPLLSQVQQPVGLAPPFWSHLGRPQEIRECFPPLVRPAMSPAQEPSNFLPPSRPPVSLAQEPTSSRVPPSRITLSQLQGTVSSVPAPPSPLICSTSYPPESPPPSPAPQLQQEPLDQGRLDPDVSKIMGKITFDPNFIALKLMLTGISTPPFAQDQGEYEARMPGAMAMDTASRVQVVAVSREERQPKKKQMASTTRVTFQEENSSSASRWQ